VISPGHWCRLVASGVAITILSCQHRSQSTGEPIPAQAPGQFAVRWVPDSLDTGKVIVEVSGLGSALLEELRQLKWEPFQWQRVLSVFADQDGLAVEGAPPPMLGFYRVQAQTVRFEPRFPLQPGVRYRAVFRPSEIPTKDRAEAGVIATIFRVPPRPRNPTTEVTQIYPTSDILPENLLKFYIHFSAPMSRGHIYDHIHLRDQEGQAIELPFLEIDEELWDPALTRLTLFIDPGRIKRGVLPLEEIGPALQAGKQFTLVINRAWQDGEGNPLKKSFRKQFQVGPPDRTPPDPRQWKVQPPKAQTREGLRIVFSDPMDHALAQRLIKVVAKAGGPVDGQVLIGDQERTWTFIPAAPWERGTFNLIVVTSLEDLAGNNIGKPFEVDLFENIQRKVATSTIQMPFEIP